VWGVVLAGGSGTRLSALTTDANGTVVPKQYCSFLGGPSLLRTTIQRLQTVLEPSRIVIVVSALHRRWWESELFDIAPENIIVQPCNRGTACGLLLPLTSILHRDPGARVIVSPSDHYVRDEETLTSCLRVALKRVHARPELLVMLGIEPDRPETGYGWITPEADGIDDVVAVTSFVEKPDAELADDLMKSGALWSSFTFVTTSDTLMQHFRRSMPWLVDRFSTRFTQTTPFYRQYALLSLYDKLPTVDFSSRVLQSADANVHVLPVPPCGWTDLGTPRRVSECVERNRPSSAHLDCQADHQSQRPIDAGPPSTRRYRPCAVDLAEVALRSFP
jgi:mannose-1-phosphate guanylyltransferase